MKIFKKKKKNGFTLVEVMVSMSIFGFLIVMLFSILLTVLKVTTLTQLRGKLRTNLQYIMSTITKDVQNSSNLQLCSDISSINECVVVDTNASGILFDLVSNSPDSEVLNSTTNYSESFSNFKKYIAVKDTYSIDETTGKRNLADSQILNSYGQLAPGQTDRTSIKIDALIFNMQKKNNVNYLEITLSGHINKPSAISERNEKTCEADETKCDKIELALISNIALK